MNRRDPPSCFGAEATRLRSQHRAWNPGTVKENFLNGWSTRALTIQIDFLPAMVVPDPPRDILVDLSAWRRRIGYVIPGTQTDLSMAAIAEQLLNMEPVEDPGSNLFVEQPIRMSHLAASLKSRSPGINPGRKIQAPRGFQAPGMPIRLPHQKGTPGAWNRGEHCFSP